MGACSFVNRAKGRSMKDAYNDLVEEAISEYGHVEIGTNIPYDLSASYSLGNLEITMTCSTANVTPVDLKFTRTLFDA